MKRKYTRFLFVFQPLDQVQDAAQTGKQRDFVRMEMVQFKRLKKTVDHIVQQLFFPGIQPALPVQLQQKIQ